MRILSHARRIGFRFTVIAIGAMLATASLPLLAEAGEAAKLECKTAYYGGGITIHYACSGRYTYRGPGVVSSGTYTIKGDQVCVRFDTGTRRCDTILPGNRLKNTYGQVYQYRLQ